MSVWNKKSKKDEEVNSESNENANSELEIELDNEPINEDEQFHHEEENSEDNLVNDDNNSENEDSENSEESDENSESDDDSENEDSDEENSDEENSDEEDSENEDSDENIEDIQPKSKKSKLPLILAGVLGAVVISTVGYIGYNTFGKSRVRSQPPVVAQSVDIPLKKDIPQTGVLGANEQENSASILGSQTQDNSKLNNSVNSAASVIATAPVSEVVATPVAIASISASSDALGSNEKPQTPIKQTSANDNVVVKNAKDDNIVSNTAVAEFEKRLSNIDSRMASIEESLSKLSKNQSIEPKQTAKVTEKATDKTTEKAVVEKEVVKKPHVKKNQNAKALPVNIDKNLAGKLPLQLRGVYPPFGDDRQAWVLNTKTGAISMIAKGDSINGMTVLKVESNQIVTTGGVIK